MHKKLSEGEVWNMVVSNWGALSEHNKLAIGRVVEALAEHEKVKAERDAKKAQTRS